MYGVDFGANDALAIHGPRGPEPVPPLPRVRGGASTSDKFIRILPLLLKTDDVVVESATVGASGVEPDEVAQIVAVAAHDLYTISNRATKNYKKDNNIAWDKGARYTRDGDPPPVAIDLRRQENVHASDAEIIYTIATEQPERLQLWKPNTDRLVRQHKSVRPHDKRNYRGPTPDGFMGRFPPFGSLPDNLQQFLGNNYGTPRADYSRSKAMPLAMAMDEPGADTRNGYERILGIYDHGYGSFYRRDTVALMQIQAKEMAGVTRIGEVSPATRKEAWKVTRKYVRQIWHILENRRLAGNW